MNNLEKLTVVIVTYKTDPVILKNCINSVDKNVKIKIIENSIKKKEDLFLAKENKRLSIHYTGKNLGYGAGNNYGFNLVDTDYVIVANPDIVFHKTFFDNLKKYLDHSLDFTIIGSTYYKDETYASSGMFKENEKKFYKSYEFPNSNNGLQSLVKVDWIVGCMMLINLKKFKTKKIFDENFFLYFEEIDLCRGIGLIKGNIFRAEDLLIEHLGNKSSIGSSLKTKIDSEKLREWHWMWSTFYYYKKNYGYFFALKKTSGKMIKAIFKIIFYTLLINQNMKNKYLCRFLGLFNSMTGKKSWYRVDNKYQ